ncbi:hypothetical protein F4679DRAFT_584759 [Xylaria curta]|nr:hypothetical protein F4679DRAFT_584759 [Xylaria curta]
MSEVKTSFSESSSITTFLRTNLPKPRSRAKPATFGKEEKPYHTPQIIKEKAVSTTGSSKNLSTDVETACASSQDETDSGYGTRSLDLDAIKSTKPIGNSVTLSRKLVPQDFLNRLADIRTLLAAPLLDTVSAKQRPTKGVSLKLKYGDCDGILYLVIQCDRHNKKEMEKFFAKSHIREIVGDDITIYIATGLRQLATQKFKVYGTTEIASSGTRIRIESPHGSSVATLGGVVVVTKQGRSVLHGLTAGHVLTRLGRNPDRPSRSSWNGTEDDSDTPYHIDESSDYSDDDQSEVLPGAHYDQASWAFPGSGSHIGNITEHSFQSKFSSTNHDWALIELHSDRSFSNLIHISYPSESDKQVHSTPLTFKLLVSTPIQSQVNVIIPTSRGNQRGTLTSSTSSLLVAPGREFVETHDVVLDDGFSLQPGDSGSWVICEITGEVYGHVVSIDMFGEAYVMPFNHILQDIKAHLNADYVGLPEEFETAVDTPIEKQLESLKKSDAGNDQQMMRESCTSLVELPWPIEATATTSDIEGLPTGLHMDFAEPQTHNTSPPKGPLRYSDSWGSPAYTDFEIGETNHMRPEHHKMLCDKCDAYPEGFRGWPLSLDEGPPPSDWTLRKTTPDQDSGYGSKPPAEAALQASNGAYNNPELRYDSSQSNDNFEFAYKGETTYFDDELYRPSSLDFEIEDNDWQLNDSDYSRGVALARRGKDTIHVNTLSFPPRKELERWVKEVWVNGVDTNSPDGEEESDIIMETEDMEQEDAGDNTDDNKNRQTETGRLAESMKNIQEPQPPPTPFDGPVDSASSSPLSGCDACQERKVKCDATETTSCSECSGRNVKCQFTIGVIHKSGRGSSYYDSKCEYPYFYDPGLGSLDYVSGFGSTSSTSSTGSGRLY